MMPAKIHILPEILCNKIAAGEIVERPASVVKEMVENAIDAGATRIFVEAEDSGRRLIRVSDNGEGMEPEDARRAFLRHATSKLADESDLASIRTMGFRGEALPSIAAVARVRMVTATKGAVTGTEIRIHGGSVIETRETAATAGTLLEVEELFYNTPARKKFLKSNPTELAHIVHAVQQQSLPHFWIHFRLTHNGAVLIDLPIVRDEKERTAQLIGPEAGTEFLELSSGAGVAINGFRLTGLISKPGRFRSTREHQEVFVNRRAIKNASLAHAVGEAYGTLLEKGRHPAVYLFLEIDPALVDVNVHPAKREIRFRDTQPVYQAVKNAVRDRLRREGLPEPAGSHPASSSQYVLRSAPATAVDGGDFGEAGSAASARYSSDPSAASMAREAMSLYRPIAETMPPAWIRPLAQVDQTYIVASIGSGSESELHLIDQHAAHERLLYERLRSQFRADRIAVQPLLIPDVVEFQPAEAVRVAEILPLLDRIGLEVEAFGERSFQIRASPALLGAVDGRMLILDILDDVEAGASPAAEETMQAVLASMACHAAIKAHQALRPEQMSRLLEDLYRQEVPPTCPHGRPIRVRFSVADLEKLFQRR